ncbi:MAG TPA: hypothetical protein VFO18_18520, partial [Methylomirabilota bacterium]|nr:hypothetical protein [Methylomirabilota bacterium]
KCAPAPAGCDEIRLLNQLDGFSVNPRVAIRFSAPISIDSVTRASAFILPLWTEPLPSPVALGQLVWDPESATLYARPERALLQARRYAVVVTTRVLDPDGRPLKPAPGSGLVSEASYGASVETLVFQQLKALGVSRAELAAAAVFTTQSVTADLEQIRTLVSARPAPELKLALGPGGTRSVYERADLEGIELRRQVATSGNVLADPAKLALQVAPASDIKTVAFGSFRSVSFLSPDRHIPAVPTRNGAPRPSGEEDVHVTIFVPSGAMPPDGWPVAIFGHGFGNDRHMIPPLVAATLARQGFATIAINVVGHGGGREGTLTLLRAGQEPLTLPAGGRGIDLDGDGKITATEGLGTLGTGPLALIAIRDGLRQTVADLMQLIRAVGRGVDLDGDGRLDLDGSRVYYFGQSLGGIYGTLLMAVDPAVPVGVLNVPGGPIVEIARQSPVFRGLALAQLQRRRPPLVSSEAKDFVEAIPLPGEAPVLAPATGALDIQAYFERVEWVSQSANPVAYAPYLRQAPLPGVGPKAVLVQWAVGDLTVPNPTTASLVRAGALQLFTSAYRHDRVVATLPERFKNPHGFLTSTASPELSDIARAAQEQIARFFLSGGRAIERPDERLEIEPPR